MSKQVPAYIKLYVEATVERVDTPYQGEFELTGPMFVNSEEVEALLDYYQSNKDIVSYDLAVRQTLVSGIMSLHNASSVIITTCTYLQ